MRHNNEHTTLFGRIMILKMADQRCAEHIRIQGDCFSSNNTHPLFQKPTITFLEMVYSKYMFYKTKFIKRIIILLYLSLSFPKILQLCMTQHIIILISYSDEKYYSNSTSMHKNQLSDYIYNGLS